MSAEQRVEEIRNELEQISNVMLVMRMEREELRRELRAALKNGNAIVNWREPDAPVAEEPMKRRALT